LNTFTIHIPPLRERLADLMPLAHHFLTHHAGVQGKTVVGFSGAAVALLEAHPFPGNIRELGNILERAVVMCQGDRILPEHLGFPEAASEPSEEAALRRLGEASGPVLPETLDLAKAEHRLVQEALHRTGGNQVQAAKLLGISRTSLRRRMERHGILGEKRG